MIGILLGNRYEVIEQIGEGGMAIVYKAKDHKLERFVAVKVLKKEYSKDMEFVNKFKVEATAAASMSDSNIVNIYDVGSKDDLNYIVMEYVKGKTLKQMIVDKKVIECDEAVKLASQIAKGLQCAHKNNIIHRDIKPHNILVTEEGIAKVTDFGIAKASNSATITNTGKVMGSAHYFSPEQAKGKIVDFRTDIYSLGVVIYEMVTGRVPYDAESPVSIAIKHIQEPVTPPKEINNNIPENLNKLILKTLEKNPINRYQTVKEMLDDLNKINNVNSSVQDVENDYTRAMDPIKMQETNIYDNVDQFKGLSEDEDNDNNDNNEDNQKDLKDVNGRNQKNKLNNRKKKKILIGSTVVIIAAIICLMMAFFVTKQLTGNDVKEVKIPNIIGMNEKDAQKAIEKLKLKFKVASRENSDNPEGTIISCSPDIETNVKEESTVSVYVSKGKKKISVPLVTGKYESVAKSTLESEGFKVELKYEHSNKIRKGIVMSQEPESNSKVDKEQTVILMVSLGKNNIEIKSVIGKTLEEAKKILGSQINFTIEYSTSSNENDKSKDGKIIEQDKIGNYKKGTGVNITILKYKEPEKKEPQEKESEIKEPEKKEPEIKEPEKKEPEKKEPEIKEPEKKKPTQEDKNTGSTTGSTTNSDKK